MDTREDLSVESKLGMNDEILLKNGLMYQMPQSLSTTLNRTLIKQYSQRQTYSAGETIIFDLNTGSRYVSPEDCGLKLTVTANGGNGFLSSAGIASLINEIRIFAKNGTELDRIQDLNQYVYSKQRLVEESDALDKYSRLYGGSPGGVPDPAEDYKLGAELTSGSPQEFIIPMSKISGLFNPTVKGMKMPPGLISGARIELVLEQSARAIQGAGVVGYTVESPELHMVASELNDQTQRILNEEAASNGLEYTYERVFSTSETTASTTLNIQIKKAVAQGLRALCVPKLNVDVTSAVDNSFSTSVGDSEFKDFQYRIGSNYYPQQKAVGVVESLYVTQASVDKHSKRPWFASGLSLDEYSDGVYGVGAGFETDTRLNLSGVPINNSATLELQATVAPAGTVKYYVFLEYVAVARSFLTNTTVKI